MIRINLLPVRQIKKRRILRTQLLGFVSSLVFLAIVLTLVGYGLNQQIDSLNGQIAALNKKKASFGPILAQIAQLKQKKTALEAKITTIQELQKHAQLPVKILDEVAVATPSSRLWLESFQQSADRLSLTGVALDNATIAQYMQTLSASPVFINADLTNSSLKELAGNKLKSFALTLQVRPPAVESSAAQKQ